MRLVCCRDLRHVGIFVLRPRIVPVPADREELEFDSGWQMCGLGNKDPRRVLRHVGCPRGHKHVSRRSGFAITLAIFAHVAAGRQEQGGIDHPFRYGRGVSMCSSSRPSY